MILEFPVPRFWGPVAAQQPRLRMKEGLEGRRNVYGIERGSCRTIGESSKKNEQFQVSGIQGKENVVVDIFL